MSWLKKSPSPETAPVAPSVPAPDLTPRTKAVDDARLSEYELMLVEELWRVARLEAATYTHQATRQMDFIRHLFRTQVLERLILEVRNARKAATPKAETPIPEQVSEADAK